MFNSQYFLWIAALLVLFMGCNDTSSGPDPEEAPSIPEIYSEETRTDLSLFENNDPGGETMSNYNDAHGIALSIGFTFTILENVEPYFEDASSEGDLNFDNGVWEWSLSETYEGQTVEIRLTADESESETAWAMYWTFDDGEGNSYEDAEILEGTVANDESEADWTIRSPNSSTGEVSHILDYGWSIPGDDQLVIMVTAYDSDGAESGSFEYDQSGPEHTLILMEPNEDDITIFWDSDTNEGYIQRGSERKCWDENFQNTPCPQVDNN